MADAALRPALLIELQDVETGVIAVGLAVIVLQWQGPLRRRGTVLPQLFHGMDRQAIARRAKNDPHQCTLLGAWVEAFEPGESLPPGFGPPAGPAAVAPLDIVGPQPQHALLTEAAHEGAH